MKKKKRNSSLNFILLRFFKSKCKYNITEVVYKPTSYELSYTEDDLKSALAIHGPVAVAVYSSASSFGFYSSGIYDDKTHCYSNNDPDHGIPKLF